MSKIETLNQLQKSKTLLLLNSLEQQAATLETQSFQSVEQMAEALQPLVIAMSQLAAVQAATARTLEIEMANGSVKIGLMSKIAQEFNDQQQASQLNQNLIWAGATVLISLALTLLLIWLTPLPKVSVNINTKTLAEQITALQAPATARVRRK